MNDPLLPANASASAVHLSVDQLERIASGEPGFTQSHWIDHLEQCVDCQGRLARAAADDCFWQQSSELLRADASGEEPQVTPDSDASDEVSPADQATALIVRSLLAPSEQDDSLGRIGRFEVFGIVGSGGMGTVLKCRDVDVDRVVAVKIPSVHLWRCPAALETLEREARSAASVVHPHVIAIYQVDRWRNVPYLVMPYFTGPSLDRRIQRNGPLQLEEAIRIARQMAEALAAAHTCGVIHRDVKPGNILLGRGVERAVLSDFGLAKVQSEATLTASGLMAGTPAYLSPEQARGHRVGPASDMFSLGSVLWTMLTGEVPGTGLHPHAIVNRIAAGQLPVSEHNGQLLPPWVRRLIDRMHQPDPERRYASADELAEVFRQCERHLADPESHRLPKPLDAAVPRRRRYERSIAVLAVVVVTSAAVGLHWPTASLQQRASVTPPRNAAEAFSERGADVLRLEKAFAAEPVPVIDADESAVDISPDAVAAQLDAIEASTQQVLIELEAMKESKR